MAAEGEIERDVMSGVVVGRAVEERAAAEARSSACGDVSHTYSRTSSLHKRRVTVAPSRGRRRRRERARAATSRIRTHVHRRFTNDASPSCRREGGGRGASERVRRRLAPPLTTSPLHKTTHDASMSHRRGVGAFRPSSRGAATSATSRAGTTCGGAWTPRSTTTGTIRRATTSGSSRPSLCPLSSRRRRASSASTVTPSHRRGEAPHSLIRHAASLRCDRPPS